MAKHRKNAKTERRVWPQWAEWLRLVRRWSIRVALGLAGLVLLMLFAYRFMNPPFTPYMLSERLRLGETERSWVSMDSIAPAMARSAVAAEDANFCLHWGFDIREIRIALEEGSGRGASTISQQVVKNILLWHGRSRVRKALEGLITPVMEAILPKRRILEIYLNVAEFDEGVFGVEAASQQYFGISASTLSETEAAYLASVLPDPKVRDASRPTTFLQRRATAIADGAATIHLDGRDDCFES